jgi:hypothetical protein
MVQMGMQEPRTRTTIKYKLQPTPQQERALAEVVWRCTAL